MEIGVLGGSLILVQLPVDVERKQVNVFVMIQLLPIMGNNALDQILNHRIVKLSLVQVSIFTLES